MLRDHGWEPIDAPIPVDARAGALLMPQLFLDCDGVLADFDAGAREAARHERAANIEARHGARRILEAAGQGARISTRTLPEMPDARVLFDAVEHLQPTILTGLPLGNWAAPQKVEWAAEHFPGVPIITCMARDKHKHMEPGDVLVDDRENHRAAYEAEGVRLRPSQECGGQPQAAGEDFSVGESAGLSGGGERRPFRPTPARTPARGSTSPARSRRFR